MIIKISFNITDKHSKGLPNPNFDQKNIMSFYTDLDLESELIYDEANIDCTFKMAYYTAKKTNFTKETFNKMKKIVKDHEIITLGAALSRCDTLFEENWFYVSIFEQLVFFFFFLQMK